MFQRSLGCHSHAHSGKAARLRQPTLSRLCAVLQEEDADAATLARDRIIELVVPNEMCVAEGVDDLLLLGCETKLSQHIYILGDSFYVCDRKLDYERSG